MRTTRRIGVGAEPAFVCAPENAGGAPEGKLRYSMGRGSTIRMRMKRWASLFVCGLTLLSASGVRAQTVATYHDRADKALQSFLLKFWDGSNQYLRHRYPADGTLTGYWTYANGWDAVMDGVERTGKLQYLG